MVEATDAQHNTQWIRVYIYIHTYETCYRVVFSIAMHAATPVVCLLCQVATTEDVVFVTRPTLLHCGDAYEAEALSTPITVIGVTTSKFKHTFGATGFDNEGRFFRYASLLFLSCVLGSFGSSSFSRIRRVLARFRLCHLFGGCCF